MTADRPRYAADDLRRFVTEVAEELREVGAELGVGFPFAVPVPGRQKEEQSCAKR